MGGRGNLYEQNIATSFAWAYWYKIFNSLYRSWRLKLTTCLAFIESRARHGGAGVPPLPHLPRNCGWEAEWRKWTTWRKLMKFAIQSKGMTFQSNPLVFRSLFQRYQLANYQRRPLDGIYSYCKLHKVVKFVPAVEFVRGWTCELRLQGDGCCQQKTLWTLVD